MRVRGTQKGMELNGTRELLVYIMITFIS